MIPFDDSNVIGQPAITLPLQIIATVLDITITGWSQVLANNEVSISSSERVIAGYLGRAMTAEKNRRPGLKKQIRIEEEVGTRSSPNSPKPEGRIDIKIIYSFDEAEYFGMECKRVTGKNKRLAKKYVDEGVMRFVTGKYSPGHDWAAMLGFVIDGDNSGCTKLICNQLARNQSTTCMEENWTAETNFSLQQDLYRTRHRQHRQNLLMTILHLFLIIQ